MVQPCWTSVGHNLSCPNKQKITELLSVTVCLTDFVFVIPFYMGVVI